MRTLARGTTLIDEAVRLIRAANKVAVASHVGPDGDAIGSLLAMGHALRLMGKECVLLCHDPVPARYRFLPGSDQVRKTLGGFAPELLIGLDATDARRLGRVGWGLVKAGLPTINLDHHATNDKYGTVNLVDPSQVAATEGVLVLLDALGVTLDEATATCLLTGLVTDTRGFRTANVTPRALSVASRLMEAGADLPRITEQALDRRSLAELGVLGQGLSNLQAEDHAIWTVLPLDGHKSDAAPTGLSSMLLGAEGAKVSAVFRERAGARSRSACGPRRATTWRAWPARWVAAGTNWRRV